MPFVIVQCHLCLYVCHLCYQKYFPQWQIQIYLFIQKQLITFHRNNPWHPCEWSFSQLLVSDGTVSLPRSVIICVQYKQTPHTLDNYPDPEVWSGSEAKYCVEFIMPANLLIHVYFILFIIIKISGTPYYYVRQSEYVFLHPHSFTDPTQNSTISSSCQDPRLEREKNHLNQEILQTVRVKASTNVQLSLTQLNTGAGLERIARCSETLL